MYVMSATQNQVRPGYGKVLLKEIRRHRQPVLQVGRCLESFPLLAANATLLAQTLVPVQANL